ncbi:MAG: serine--tRNA ligase [Spirochaetales bacterium]|nr:serine--tRNA ligase [Spirochaetales bacterium]
MLDIKFIKDNVEMMKENAAKRNVAVDIDKVVSLYNRKTEIQFELDTLRQKRNENAAKMKGKMEQSERNALIDEGKDIKAKIASLEEEEKKVAADYLAEAMNVPNLTHPSVPVGKTDKDSQELRKVGTIRKFDFEPKNHVQLGEALDLIDFDTASSVSGQKFYYLKNEAALLELALVQYGMQKVTKKGFKPHLTPDIAKASILEGIGFNPRGEETNIYSIENTDQCLVGTAEITLGGINAGKILNEADLPIKMVGFSHCFRTEAGAAGQATKGLYRVHQFSKVEMFIICKPEESDAMLETLRGIEEEIYQELGIPYRVLNVSSGDLGNPAYKKYDLEAWMPGRNDYGEITSTSNCTDYQSRRLNIRFKNAEGKNQFVHMLNGTVIAVPRVIISIMENFQNADGSIDIPKVLVPWTGFDKIMPRK